MSLRDRWQSNDFKKEMVLDAIASGKGFEIIRTEILKSYLDSKPKDGKLLFLGLNRTYEALRNDHPECLSRHKTHHVFFTQDTGDAISGIKQIAVDDALAFKPDMVIALSKQNKYMDMVKKFENNGAQVVMFRDMVDRKTVSHYWDRILKILDIEQDKNVKAIRDITEKNKTVCFASFHVYHHYFKFLRELKQNGYSVVFFTGYPYLPEISEPFESYCDYTITSGLSYGLELDYILSKCRFSFLHIVADMSGILPIALAIESSNCPVVTEYNDFKQIVFNDETSERYQSCLSETEYRVEKKAQSYVFRMSAGIVYKDSPEVVNYLTKKYKKKVLSLSFKPYCSLNLNGSEPKNKINRGTVRIVYAGSLPPDNQWHTNLIDRSFLKIVEELTTQGIEFTIYNATDTNGTGFEKYYRLAEENELFEYRKALPYDSLIPEIAQHDFGIHCFDYSHCFENSFFINTSLPSKVFTYLEAGLPVIVNGELTFMADYVTNHGLGMAIAFTDLSKLKTLLEYENVRKFKRTIKEKRQLFSYRYHFHEIMNFYNESHQNWKRRSWR